MNSVGNIASPVDIFEWWVWLLSIGGGPLNNPAKGGNINQDQTKTFFCQVCTLGTGSDLTRKYVVHPDNAKKQTLIPVLTSEASTAENPGFTDAQLLSKAKHDLMNPQVLFLNVDDEYLLTPSNADQYYVESDAGDLTPANNNVLGLNHAPTTMRCVGYFVLIDPLPSGKHHITFGGRAGPPGDLIQTLVSYDVQVP